MRMCMGICLSLGARRDTHLHTYPIVCSHRSVLFGPGKFSPSLALEGQGRADDTAKSIVYIVDRVLHVA